MGFTTGVLFCTNCGSSYIDVNGWEGPDKAVLKCYDCDHTTVLTGFTVGRARLTDKQLQAAAGDVAVFGHDSQVKRMILDKTRETIDEMNF